MEVVFDVIVARNDYTERYLLVMTDVVLVFIVI